MEFNFIRHKFVLYFIMLIFNFVDFYSFLIEPGESPWAFKAKKMNFTVAIDFDGTIVEDNYPSIGPLFSKAKSSIQKFSSLGIAIIIWTCRTGEHMEQAKQFLIDNDIPFDYFNENSQERCDHYALDSRKISADVYIDDRNYGGFPGWDIVRKGIINQYEFWRRLSLTV